MKIEIVKVDGKYYLRKSIFGAFGVRYFSIKNHYLRDIDKYSWDSVYYIMLGLNPTSFNTPEKAEEALDAYIEELIILRNYKKEFRKTEEIKRDNWTKSEVVKSIKVPFWVWFK